MSNVSSALRSYFNTLGLEPEVADLYLTLHSYGPQSISELSRRSGVERTRIYRLIDAMTHANLIEVETHYKQSILKAAPLDNLQVPLSNKEEELQQLRSALPELQRTLQHQNETIAPTKIQYYKGPEGLKQMFWNQTRSRSEARSILYENIQNRTGAAFFERWVRKCNQQGIKSRSIINTHFLDTQKQWYARKDNERLRNWQARHLPDTVFRITYSTVIYDDIVSYYSWHKGNLFGIEIYNQDIADTQRAFFEMLWKQGAPIPNRAAQLLDN